MLIIHGDSKAAVERKAGFEKEMKDDGVEKDSTRENPLFYKIQYNGIDIFKSKYLMKREVVEMIEKDQKTLQEALKEVLPRIDALKLKVDKEVPLEEYQTVSDRIEEVRKLVTGLLHMIKPLNYYPRKVSEDDLTNKCNAGLEALIGQDKFLKRLEVEKVS